MVKRWNMFMCTGKSSTHRLCADVQFELGHCRGAEWRIVSSSVRTGGAAPGPNQECGRPHRVQDDGLRFVARSSRTVALDSAMGDTKSHLATQLRGSSALRLFTEGQLTSLARPKEFTLAHHKENEHQFHKQQGRGLVSQEMTNKKEAQFQCRHLQEGRRL